MMMFEDEDAKVVYKSFTFHCILLSLSRKLFTRFLISTQPLLKLMKRKHVLKIAKKN